MRTTDVLTASSNAFKICNENNGDKIVVLSGRGSTQLVITKPGEGISFESIKNVYHKILITQSYSPLYGKYIIEIRIDGVLIHKEVLQSEPQEMIDIYTYAGFPGNDLTEGIKYRNYLFYTF